MNKLKDTSINVCFIDNIPDNVQDYLKSKLINVKPFYELKNIILSPHRGYSPFSDLLRWNEVIENIKRVAQGTQNLINVVNLDDEY